MHRFRYAGGDASHRAFLLSCGSQQLRTFARRKIAAPWIDVDTSAACVTRIDRQALRFAFSEYVQKDPFDTLFVEFLRGSQADDIFEQSFLIDLWADIVDLQAGPVRLSGDRAVRLQKIRYQCFLDGIFFLVAF